jgi:translation elongation factor EF-Tu-like GTPase
MFEMKVQDIFYMRGQGMVLYGLVKSGELVIGDGVEVRTPSHSVCSVVAGLEIAQKIVRRARAGEIVGVLLKSLSPEQLSDGLHQTEKFGWKVLDLSLHSVKRPWWRIW